MPGFFTDVLLAAGENFPLLGEDARHIALSLRMHTGDRITVCDREGNAALCELEEIAPTAVLCRVLSLSPAEGELPVEVRLYQGCPKGEKLELIVQKATELGVSAVIPFISRRCISRPKAEKHDRMTERLSRIAREAAGQSGRGRLPEILPPVSFSAALAHAADCDRILFCYEEEKTRSLRTVLEEAAALGVKSLAVFVGCEGGFAPEEAEEAARAGAVSVSLGRRILRCETAPLYALSAVGYAFEK